MRAALAFSMSQSAILPPSTDERPLTDVCFENLGLHPDLLKGLEEAGFMRCTPIQALTLPLALTGRDVAGQAQTGTGKTLAFLVTIINRLLTTPAHPQRRANDPRAVELIRTIAGDDFHELPASSMGGEDFSYVLEQVPGAMAFLGVSARDEDASSRAPLHNPAMMIDESVLPKGVALHCAFATGFLEKGWE